jgi:methyltransferase (TIGR00027 family)
MAEMDSVGMTALMIAKIRADEEARPDAVFVDPYAKLFAHPKVEAAMKGWAAAYPEGIKIWPALIRNRTRWFDDMLQRAMDEGAVQVVVLGAGCCCRAERFKRPGVTFYEVDTQGVLSFKADRLASAGHTYSAVAVVRDYTAPGLFDALVASGLDRHRKTFVIWEGNTYYMPESEVRVGMSALARAFRDVTMAVDYYGHEIIEGRSRTLGMRNAMEALTKFGIPWTGWVDDVYQLAKASSLRVLEEQRFNTLHARLFPNWDLGVNADPEYGLALLTNVGVGRD